MNPVVPEGEGWRYKDSFDYPETTGYFSVNDEGIIKVRRFNLPGRRGSLLTLPAPLPQFFALVPKKYCMTFVPQADGSWVIKDSSAKVETAVKVCRPASSLSQAAPAPCRARPARLGPCRQVVDLKPEPSLLGAGGLPKGAINLGEEADEGVRNWGGCWWRGRTFVYLRRPPPTQFNALW